MRDVMLLGKRRQDDVPCELYRDEGHSRRAVAKRCATCIRRLPYAPPPGEASGRRQTAKTHTGGDPTLTLAMRQQTAIAACLLTGAGAAVKGARRRQSFFDPIQAHSGLEVGRHGHGRLGNEHKPCST